MVVRVEVWERVKMGFGGSFCSRLEVRFRRVSFCRSVKVFSAMWFSRLWFRFSWWRLIMRCTEF